MELKYFLVFFYVQALDGIRTHDLRFTKTDGFKDWLLKERRKITADQILQYVKRYGYVLDSGDASELLKISPKNRQHTMRAISALAKYSGCYDRWLQIKTKYRLKWSTGDSLGYFEQMINEQSNITQMLGWVKDATDKLPANYANSIKYNVLTGLRPSEACLSIQLLQSQEDGYLNRDKMILEHYKKPELFIRRTKKAFISVVNDSLIDIAEQSHSTGYNALRLAIRRALLDMHAKYCRAIYSTHLRKAGIEPELIDMLQGRIPKSVFAKHYFRPDFEHDKARVMAAVNSLQTIIARR